MIYLYLNTPLQAHQSWTTAEQCKSEYSHQPLSIAVKDDDFVIHIS